MPVSGNFSIGARQIATADTFRAINPASEGVAQPGLMKVEPGFSGALLPDMRKYDAPPLPLSVDNAWRNVGAA